jgi:hypothetical protein
MDIQVVHVKKKLQTRGFSHEDILVYLLRLKETP